MTAQVPATGRPDRSTPHPYGDLIAREVQRAEADLRFMRERALSILTTVAGVITLLTGAITFGASKSETERGINVPSIVILGLGLALVVSAAVCSLVANAPTKVQNTKVDDLVDSTTVDGWLDGEDAFERERLVAATQATYLKSLQKVVNDRVGPLLQWAIRLVVAGLAVIAIAAIVIVATL